MEEYLAGDGALFATVLQLGHFVAVCVHHDWPGMEVRPAPTRKGALSFFPVWPVTSSGQWPPLMPIDGLGDPHLITEYFMMAPPGTPARS